MMARNTNVPFKGRIQKRKTHNGQIVTFGLQRAAGPYRWARSGHLFLVKAPIPPSFCSLRFAGNIFSCRCSF
jgi:hypothetical protein